MSFHANVRILSGRYRHRFIAKRAGRRHAVELALVIVGAVMGGRLEMVSAEGFLAVLTFKGQEIHEMAGSF